MTTTVPTNRFLHRHIVTDRFLRRHLPYGSGEVIDIGASATHEYEDEYRRIFTERGYTYKPAYFNEGWDATKKTGDRFVGVFCSHVLEHIQGDQAAAENLWALAEKYLVVIVPIAASHVEYEEAKEEEWGHWRRYSIDGVLSLFPELPDVCEVEDVISFLPSGEPYPFDNWQLECLWFKQEAA